VPALAQTIKVAGLVLVADGGSRLHESKVDGVLEDNAVLHFGESEVWSEVVVRVV
jgi:hypothetical protein